MKTQEQIDEAQNNALQLRSNSISETVQEVNQEDEHTPKEGTNTQAGFDIQNFLSQSNCFELQKE